MEFSSAKTLLMASKLGAKYEQRLAVGYPVLESGHLVKVFVVFGMGTWFNTRVI